MANINDSSVYVSAVKGLRQCEREKETARLKYGWDSRAYRGAVASEARQAEYVTEVEARFWEAHKDD
jgi:hypothetical protein